jgi:hypothetical protein
MGLDPPNGYPSIAQIGAEGQCGYSFPWIVGCLERLSRTTLRRPGLPVGFQCLQRDRVRLAISQPVANGLERSWEILGIPHECLCQGAICLIFGEGAASYIAAQQTSRSEPGVVPGAQRGRLNHLHSRLNCPLSVSTAVMVALPEREPWECVGCGLWVRRWRHVKA